MWGSTLASSIPVIGKFTEVRVESTTDTTLSLVWDFIGNFSRFRVYYTEVGGVRQDTNYLTGKTITITGLISGRTYDIFVRAEYADQVVNTGIITITTNVLDPSPATNLFPTEITDNSFTVNWTWGANTTRGKVYHRKLGTTDWSTGGYITDTQNTSSGSITGLEQGNEYEVKIRSENNNIVIYSDTLKVTTVVLQPSPVTGINATNITHDSATLNWTVGANTSRLRIYTSEDNVTFSAGNYISNPQTTTTGLANLKQGTKYYVKIRSENGEYSVYSSVYSFTTLTLQSSPVTGLFINDITDTTFNVNWTWGANTTRVRIYYSTNNVDFTTTNYISNSEVNSNVLSGLTMGQLYYVKIRSENGASGVFSNTITATTTTTNVSPSPVTNLSVNNITENSMKLNWTVGANTDKLKVYWSKNNSTWIASNDLLGTATSYNITGLESATEYYLKVRSENSGQTVFSNMVTGKTTIVIDTDNLFSYYPLNETSGEAIDTINGNNLAVSNVFRNGSFYSFNGSTSSAVSSTGISNHKFFNSSGDIPFTIRMSILIDAFAKSKFIISRQYSPDEAEWVVNIDNGILKVRLYENGDTIKYISRGYDVSGLSTSIFYRVGIRYVGNDIRTGLALFINGNRVDNLNFGSSSYNGMASTRARTSVASTEASSGYRFAGDMKKLYIDKGGYLSDKEMKADFEQNL